MQNGSKRPVLLFYLPAYLLWSSVHVVASRCRAPYCPESMRWVLSFCATSLPLGLTYLLIYPSRRRTISRAKLDFWDLLNVVAVQIGRCAIHISGMYAFSIIRFTTSAQEHGRYRRLLLARSAAAFHRFQRLCCINRP